MTRIDDPLITAAQFLTTQLDWCRHATDEQGQAYAVGVFAEIGDCAGRMRSLVDGPGASKYLGECGAEFDTATLDQPDRTLACTGDVMWRIGSAIARCKTCGAGHNPGQRQDWIDQLRREWLYTATEIADAYPEVKANTISQWASRGLLVSHGKHGNSPLYKVGEVLDLAAGDAARREEARAARARRREGASA